MQDKELQPPSEVVLDVVLVCFVVTFCEVNRVDWGVEVVVWGVDGVVDVTLSTIKWMLFYVKH